MNKSILSIVLSSLTLAASGVLAGTQLVTNLQDSGPGSLRDAIQAVNGSSPGPQIIDATSVTGTITLASSLPVVTAQGMTLIGPGPGNLTIDGAGKYQTFFIGVSVDAAQGYVYETTNSQISISGLTVAHALVQGGNAGVNAGGGAGLGGALFVNAGNVVISNMVFTANSAVGGAGGAGISTAGTLTTTGGGGGGLGGNGANGGSTTNGSAGGGGGGFGYGAGGSSLAGNVGSGTFSGGANGGAGGNYGTPGGINGGGGFGPPLAANGGGGGGGGVAGGAGQGYFDYSASPAVFHGAGGNGGFGGGGGGGGGYQFTGNSDGGNGGFGGGGGGGQQFNYGGNGGFGGGAGSGAWPGSAGFGGGSAASQANGPSAGGGGLGAGGAIFVRQGAWLTVLDCNFSGNTVTGGSGGSDGATQGGAGAAIGQAMFLGAGITNSVSGTNVVVLSDNIGGGNDANASGGLVKSGAGTLVLAGTNSYTGPTTLAAGVLEIDGDISSSSNLTVAAGTTLTGSGNVGETLINSGATVAPGPSLAALGAGDVTWNGTGNYNWKIYDAAGAPGTGYDVLNVNGVLDLTGATTINLNLWSLSSASPLTSGNAINFNNAQSRSWTLVHTTDGVIRFNASKFHINTAPANGAGGFSNPLGPGVFSLAVVGTDLVLEFVTPLSVTTQPASGITAGNATLNATVNPNGAASSVYFQWGTTTGYGNTTPVTNVGTGINAVAVSAVISNLAPGTLYHYQAIATNSAGIVDGGDAVFTTSKTNAALAGLTLSAGPIAPAFDPGTTGYSASLGNISTNVTVTPASADSTATIQVSINGGAFSAVASGSACSPLTLNVGANTISIKVTAQDGVTTQTYTLTVNRAPSSNAVLAGLALSTGPISPAFNPSVTSYTAGASNTANSATVTPTTADNTATVQVQVNGGPLTAANSGSPSGQLALNVGANVINVVVTAQDGVTTMTYTLNVTRLGLPAATTLAASGIGASNATMNASVTANGLDTTVYFEWGTTAGYGNTTAPADIGSGSSATPVNVALAGLLPGATYHYAIVASNSLGTVTGADTTFTISALAPGAATLPASGVTSVGATLNASIIPNGAATTVYFQWGTNTSYGSTTPLTSAGSGNGTVAMNAAIANLLPGTTYHYAVTASNSVGTVSGADVSFMTPAAAPAATSLPATGVAVSNATLNASVNPNGAATSVYFAWGTTTSYGNTVGQTAVGGGTSTVAVNAPIAGLLPGTTYHYALVASNSVGTVSSADATFTTPALAPVATTQPASGITAASASLNASVNPNGTATTVYFQWGTNTSYGSVSSLTSAGSGNGDVAITIALGSLLPGTTYHFAVVASNSVGVVNGADSSFTTPATAPSATTLAAGGIAASNATLNASVNPNGATTTAWFVWGTTAGYGNTAGQTAIGSGTSATAINAAIGNLLPATTYHFAIVASNSVGTVTGADAIFNTPAVAPAATTLPAGGISAGTATLNASVNPGGAATSVYFEWGTNTSYGSITTLASAGAGTGDMAMNAAIANLLPGTTYHFAVVASNSVGAVTGADSSFTTPAGAPLVTTLAAGGIGASNAALNASVNPQGAATMAWFEWGTNTSYGNIAGQTAVGSGVSAAAINAAVANLLPATTYHYTVVASNSVGLVTGADMTFTTPSLAPIVTTLPASGVTPGAATLNGAVNPNGAATTVYFQWGTNTGYGNTTTVTPDGNGLTMLPSTALVSGFAPGVAYHYRVVASNIMGTSYGADREFGAPLLALNGPGLLTNQCHTSFTDPGATATGFIGIAQTTIAAGATHGLALQGNGTVVAWGDNGAGETAVPAGLSNVVAVAAGDAYSLALQSDGVVVGWGSGETSVPAGLSNVVAISAGSDFSLALESAGTLVGWGDNSLGQLSVPQGLSNVVAVVTGLSHSLALQGNGTVAAWGDNSAGETTVPAGLSNVVAVAAGNDYSLALQSNGMVVGWGDNSFGQISMPAGLSNVLAIAAGPTHGLALQSNGMVVGWGDNSFGQISVPAGLSNVLAIAAGNGFSLALQANGTVVGWGKNGVGQTAMPSNLVAALPQMPLLGDLTSSITVSGTVDATVLATYQLTYTIVDALGTTNTAVRTVVVADTTPPQMTCPQDIVQSAAPGQSSVVVDFPTPATADKCSAVTVVCTPPSGSVFPAGSNIVTCVATDTSSNSASCSFHVMVDVPPVINAGTSQTITLPTSTVDLDASVMDQGLLAPITMAWSKKSGPGRVLFGNSATITTTASFSTNGVYVLQLLAGDGLASATGTVTILVHAPPVIAQGPAATSGLVLGDGTIVVASGQPADFTVGATDPGGNPLSYLWNFGDGATSTNQDPTYTFTNCAPATVTVTVNDGISSTNQSVAVQPACQMTLNAETVHVHFNLKQLDQFAARGFMDLPKNFNPNGVSVAVQAGAVQQIFILNAKGKGVNTAGTFSVAPTPHKGWAFSVNFKGVYAAEWAANGLTNATVRKAPVNVPLFVVFDSEPLLAFTADQMLHYTAVKNNQGSAAR